MKSSQLIAISFLHVLVQIEGQTSHTRCGRLVSDNSNALLARSFRANHHWPWQAAIYHQYNDDDDPVYQCGGTRISSKAVLTAGHCVSIANAPLDVEKVSVWLGRLNLGVNEISDQSFGVSEIRVHPNYSSIDFVNDIAIVTLSAEAMFNNYVQPICLWKSDKTDLSEVVGKSGTVVGWGLTENGKISEILQQATFPVVDFHTCLEHDRQFYGQYISRLNFCAGNLNGTGACKGDSGGSITFKENRKYYIRGIVSVGQLVRNPITQTFECNSRQYAIFTDVAKYLSWIENPVKRQQITAKKEVNFSTCGQLSPTPNHLTSSHAYDTHRWPWRAAIFHRRTASSDLRYKCAGTLISSKLILTTATCVQTEPEKISIFFGSRKLTCKGNEQTVIWVPQVYVHPNYVETNYGNNIAIIKLSTDATFNRYVRPVCLWRSNQTQLSAMIGKSGRVIGWGRTDGELRNTFQEAPLPVASYSMCLGIFGWEIELHLSNTTFCAVFEETIRVSLDEGAPLTFRRNGTHYIRGIATVLEESGTITNSADISTSGAIFTDVAKYLPWIRSYLYEDPAAYMFI